MATLIGTPPNLVFAAQYTKLFPELEPVTFARWMILGLPYSSVFLAITWYYLTHLYVELPATPLHRARLSLRESLETLGPMKPAERRIALIFAGAALGWIFREPIRLGPLSIPGWASILGISEYVHDSTVAMIVTLLLFLVPGNLSDGEPLLDWEWASKIPWGVLILFGGGLALADAFQATELSRWTGRTLLLMKGVSLLVLMLVICFTTTFLTEVTSNTATTTILMPVLAAASTSLNVNPGYMMVPATLSASCAFMLPVATPPNAIIFGSPELSIPKMARAGFTLNLLGVLLVTGACYTLMGWMLPAV